jgi:hypothetical protein
MRTAGKPARKTLADKSAMERTAQRAVPTNDRPKLRVFRVLRGEEVLGDGLLVLSKLSRAIILCGHVFTG